MMQATMSGQQKAYLQSENESNSCLSNGGNADMSVDMQVLPMKL
jgi:hypothetical protein